MGMPWDSVADLIKVSIDKIWPDKTEAEKAKSALEQAQLAGQLKEIEYEWQNAASQIEVNKAEASNSNVFVSGWRPFVGWVCGLALAYAGIIEPFARFIAVTFFDYHGAFPVIDTTITMQTLGGILGLGAMRSIDKYNGVAAK